MIKKVLLFIGICFLFGLKISKAQENTTKIPLINVLQQLEDKFDVHFSFADKNIDTKVVFSPDYSNSISQILSVIEANLDLKFIAINIKLYAIKTTTESFNFVELQNLKKIIITGYLTKGIKLNDDATTTITPKYFGILPGLIEPDILQTIQALPGIQSVDERISDINIRGGTNDQNLILWEGIKMYQTGHFFGLISAFNPYLIKNVTVSKNGTSAIHGDGVSGVIDIKTIDDISNRFSSGFGANLINTDAYGIIPINKKLELQLSARRSITDFWATPTYNSYFKRVFQNTGLTNKTNTNNSRNERFYFYDFSGKLIYNLTEKDKISVSLINIVNNLDFEEQANNTLEKLKSTLQQNSLATTLNYNRQFNSLLTTNAQIYFSNYKLDATNFKTDSNQLIIQENEVLDIGFKMHANYKLSENINYLGGYQFSEVSVTNSEEVNIPDFKRFVRNVNRQHAIFNEIKFTSNSAKTIFKLGLRNNYFQKFAEFNVEPRISFSQKLKNNFRLEILGEVKSQTTSQIIDLQNDFLGVEKRRWILANNNDIPITKSNQLSAGIHYNKNKLLISTEVYFKEVINISTRSQGFQNQFQFVNAIGKYTIKGIDFLINKKFKNVSTWLSYSYNNNQYLFNDLNNGKSFPNNLAIDHAINFASTYNWKKINFGLGVNWRTGRPFSKPLNNNAIVNNAIQYGSPNANNLPNYLRIDLSLRYHYSINNKTKISTGFSLWNLTNNKTTLNKYYSVNSQNTITETENKSLGITPNFSIRVDF